MKKKKIIFIGLVTCSLALFSLFQSKKAKTSISELTLMNVEALANDEIITGDYTCAGIGDIECPDGAKVEVVYILTALDEL